jgi:hypothetical protein
MEKHELLRLVQEALGESGVNAPAKLQGGLWVGDTRQTARDGYLYLENAVLRSQAVGCRVFRSSDQSIPDAALTVVAFDSVRHDPFGMWQSGAPTRLTVKYPGLYLAIANLTFDANTTGQRAVQIRANGTQTIGNVGGAPVNAMLALACTTLYPLDEGEFLEVYAYQDSGAALNICCASSYSVEFMAVRVV